MRYVTSGSSYLDIDAYAGCIAYAELLNAQGVEALAATTAPLNESITPSLRKFGKSLVSQVEPGGEFTLIDVSEPAFFDPLTNSGEVVEIIDHHPGQEVFWHEKLGDKAQIEVVGAACTQVTERWEQADKLTEMDPATATLLVAGILDNTLNFNAGVTNQRDHNAYELLQGIADLSEDFAAGYFSECQAQIEADLAGAIKNDAKSDMRSLPHFMGQLVVWDGMTILTKDKTVIEEVMSGLSEDWALNLISISEGKSYILGTNPASQAIFKRLFSVNFTDGVSSPIPMMLRKEIHRAALDKAATR